jgi:hypothetical protein
MRGCPTCADTLRSRGIVQATRDGTAASGAIWECARGHRFAEWTDAPDLQPWQGDWWPTAGIRADLEADRPPHWS